MIRHGFDTTGLRDRLPVDYRDGDRSTGWLEADDWRDVMHAVGALFGVKFEVLAFQAYRDGRATVDWHFDDYAHQAMLSIGATRTFGLRNDGVERRFPMEDGDILYLTGRQEHAILADPDVTGERCSIVFRAYGEG